MTRDDGREFAATLALLDEAYGRETSRMRAEVYYQGLEDCALEDVKRAVGAHIRTQDRYPTVAQIRRLIVGEPADLAALAWREVDRAILEIGTYESAAFADPVIHFVVEAMGGWPAMGLIDKESEPFREQDFRRLYAVGLRRGITWRDVPAWLVGRVEADNNLKGLPEATPPPREIACDYLTAQRRLEIGERLKPKELTE